MTTLILAACISLGLAAQEAPPVGPARPAQEYPLDNFADEGEWRKQAVEIARRHIEANRAEFGLGPRDAPVLREVEIRNVGRDIFAYVHYREQAVGGVPVAGSDIQVIVSVTEGRIVNASGRWLPGLATFPAPAVSEERARRALVGLKLGYSDFAGQPRHVTVGAEAIREPGTLEIISLEGSKRARLAWKIRVEVGEMPWDVYVDAMTGKVLRVVQQFQT